MSDTQDVQSVIFQLRENYSKKSLSEDTIASDPFVQLALWMKEAIQAKVSYPNAMTLSTVSNEGKPSARVVLLRGIEDDLFEFYTNYNSRKGQQLAANPNAALTFFWRELERQVIVEGRITKVDKARSQEYFESRPRESQLGAWASDQSQVVAGRSVLDNRFAEFEQKFIGQDVPRPEHWGGYVLQPHFIEFWQGRLSRLHDRVAFTAEGDQWKIQRLAP